MDIAHLWSAVENFALIRPLRGQLPPKGKPLCCYIPNQFFRPHRQTVFFIEMESVKKLLVIVGNNAAAPLVIQQGKAAFISPGGQRRQHRALHGLGDAEHIADLGPHIVGHRRQNYDEPHALALAAPGQRVQAVELLVIQRPAFAARRDGRGVVV